MIKKLIMLAMAVAALAAIIPAAANAEGKLTSGSSLVGVGTEITLTNDAANGLITRVPAFGTNLVCEKITAHAEVTKNNGTAFEGVAGATGTTENCELVGLAPAEVTDPTVVGINSTSTGTGEVTLSFIAHVAGTTCNFATVGPGVFHYALPSSSTVTLTETELFSPECGEAFIEGSVTVENGSGAVVLE